MYTLTVACCVCVHYSAQSWLIGYGANHHQPRGGHVRYDTVEGKFKTWTLDWTGLMDWNLD